MKVSTESMSSSTFSSLWAAALAMVELRRPSRRRGPKWRLEEENEDDGGRSAEKNRRPVGKARGTGDREEAEADTARKASETPLVINISSSLPMSLQMGRRYANAFKVGLLYSSGVEA
ncbi:hypothetical protein BHE74_00030355, partial [Ensete ventricosum]